MNKIKIDKSTLEQLLCNELLSREEASRRLGINIKTLRKYIKLFNVEIPFKPKNNIRMEEIKLSYTDYLNNKCTLDFLCKKFNYTIFGLINLLKKNNIYKKKTEHTKHFIFNENYFNEINSEDKAYFLGFIMADGCVYIGKKNEHLLRIHLHKKDDYVIKEFIKRIEINKQPTYTERHVEIKVFSKNLINNLINKKCTQRKSLTLKFPDCVPNHLIRHFIRGYFDGDGTVCYFFSEKRNFLNKKASLYSSYSFNEKFKKIMKEILNLNFKIVKRGNISEALITTESTLKIFYDFLYKDATIYLDRKRKKFIEIFELQNLKRDNRNIPFKPIMEKYLNPN